MNSQNQAVATQTHTLGISLCLGSMFIFAMQDSITKVLVQDMAVAQFVMVRYWVFALFAVGWVAWRGELRRALHTRKPGLQIARSLLSVAEIAIFNLSLRFLGLAEAHALLAVFPLIAIALASPMLGEKVGLRRWMAVAAGFAGTLIILRPGQEVFKPEAFIALSAAVCFAFYNLITRFVSAAGDSFNTNMLYMALVGCASATLFGIPEWREPTSDEWLMMAVLSVTGIFGHLLLVKALEHAPTSVLQPFNYSLLVFATVFGVLLFAEIPDLPTLIGSAIITGSGLYVIMQGQTRRPKDV